MKPDTDLHTKDPSNAKPKDTLAVEGGIPCPYTTSSLEWMQLAIQLLAERSDKRTLITQFVCDEAAKMLLEDANKRGNITSPSPSSPLADSFNNVYTPAELKIDMIVFTQKGAAISTQRLEAAQLLVAGCLSGLVCGVTESTEKAVLLAKKAVKEYPSSMTYTVLAWALLDYSSGVSERSTQDAILELVAAAANSGLALLLGVSDLGADDRAYLTRLSWLMALVRDIKAAELGVGRLLRANSEHYMGMLLLALLHTVQADYSSARATVASILKSHQEDIVGSLLHIVLRQVTENTVPVLQSTAGGPSPGVNGATSVDFDVIGKELAIVLARVQAYSAKVAFHPTAGASSSDHITPPSLKQLCSYRVLGERPPGNEIMNTHLAQHHAAHYWSILAYVCVRLGVYTLAEVVIESGMNFIANQPTLHHRALADLLCCSARLSLLQLGGQLPAFEMVRELNLLGSFMPPAKAASFFPSSLSTKTKDHSGYSTTNSLNVDVEPIDQRELSVVFTHLLQAVEMCPNHTDAHFLMGTLRLLDASQPDLPKSEKHVKLLEAAVYFEQCIERSPFCIEAYLGLGNVRKVQEADEIALDLYATATELWFRQPLISFEQLVFLFD